jgi:hypothetical protein
MQVKQNPIEKFILAIIYKSKVHGWHKYQANIEKER